MQTAQKMTTLKEETVIQSTGPIVPIETLARAEKGRVVEVCGENGCQNRIREMGLCVGCTVEMHVPGTPCIIAINGRRLSLRLEESTMVLVESCG